MFLLKLSVSHTSCPFFYGYFSVSVYMKVFLAAGFMLDEYWENINLYCNWLKFSDEIE